MLVGYNTNISYKGTVYHVQTEDSGVRNPHIITLLYDKGTILARKKTSYAHIAGDQDYKDKVRELMKEQHKAMIKELIHGKHTPGQQTLHPSPEPPAEAAPAETAPAPALQTPEPPAVEPPAPAQDAKAHISKSLDDILLDYILREENK
ncbi:MAG: hypothetical protein FIA94_07000 [Nitrospirae bacterium]|nr:hypothetical protein [Nitrospirota bacterium]